jgi:hypothetical protein
MAGVNIPRPDSIIGKMMELTKTIDFTNIIPKILIKTENASINIEYQRVDLSLKQFVRISLTTLNPGDIFEIFSLEYYDVDPTTTPWSMYSGEQYFITTSGDALVSIKSQWGTGCISVIKDQGNSWVKTYMISEGVTEKITIDSLSRLCLFCSVPNP